MDNNSNHDLLTKGFDRLLKTLAPFVIRELIQTYGADFWQVGVMDRLYDEQKRDLPTSG